MTDDTDTYNDTDSDIGGASRAPAFADLYGDSCWRPRCAAREFLTPRNAAQLWATATSLASVLDAQFDDVRAPVLPCDSEWRRMPWVMPDRDPDWCGQFVDSVVSLADDLATGRCPVPRCTAEEMALQLIVEDVTDPPHADARDQLVAVVRGLPVHQLDQEWDDLAAALFPHPAVRRLVADRFGGHVDDHELVAETGLVRLAVHRWYDPFDLASPRPAAACGCGNLS